MSFLIHCWMESLLFPGNERDPKDCSQHNNTKCETSSSQTSLKVFFFRSCSRCCRVSNCVLLFGDTDGCLYVVTSFGWRDVDTDRENNDKVYYHYSLQESRNSLKRLLFYWKDSRCSQACTVIVAFVVVVEKQLQNNETCGSRRSRWFF